MDKQELKQFGKRELVRIILHQQEVISELKKQIVELQHYLKAFDNAHTPSSKKRSKENTERDESKPRFPGKPEGSNGGGIKLPKPDKEEQVTKDHCPECGEKLGKPNDTYSFRQMDIPTPQFITTKYIVHTYACKCCGAFVDAGANLDKGFYGANTTAFLGCLRNEGLSHEAGARFLFDVYKLPISNVTAYNKLVELSKRMSNEREGIRKEINKSNYANMDETGLRQDGTNGHVWNACTPSHCLFEYDLSRGAAVAQRILADFSGALVTDDYQGYAWHSPRQLCWSHLIREAKDFAEKYDGAKIQYKRLKFLYDKAKRAQENQDASLFNKLAWELEDIAACYHPLDGCKIMYEKIHNRTELWLLGVRLPYVPLTNNHAERCLRKVVLHRNRIGCIRNENGELFVNVFLTCTSTWRLQGKNIYEELFKFAS